MAKSKTKGPVKKKTAVSTNGHAPKKKAKFRQLLLPGESAAVKPRVKRAKAGRKKVKKKSVELDRNLDTAKEKKQAISPESRIQAGTRGFKLSWGSLPWSKKLSEKQSSKMMKEVTAKPEMIKRAKALFEKHPALTAVASAKNKVTALFNARTLPFPEKGVRLFMLETKDIDYKNLSSEEIDQLHAAQISRFTEEIRELMGEYAEAVEALQRAWPEVLKGNKESLKEFYDESDYPTAEEVSRRLYVRLNPYNIELPKEYGYVSAAERQLALQAYEAQFKEAVQMQEAFVTELMKDAIDQMIESVSGFHAGTKNRFGNSVIENVFNAFEEFKTKAIRYGILEGTAIQSEFERAISFMREGSTDAKTLPGLLRQSGAKREDLVEKMGVVRDSLVRLMEKRKRRSLIAD